MKPPALFLPDKNIAERFFAFFMGTFGMFILGGPTIKRLVGSRTGARAEE